MRTFYVYIMANPMRTLYTGMTNNLERRMYEHKEGIGSEFTAKYGINRLVYYESTNDVHVAIAREKEIKGWVRTKKETLIVSKNPNWRDLSLDWTNKDPYPKP
ncbi:MAG: GIY-YIG nuclease family protein [Caldilineaceae bacterium]